MAYIRERVSFPLENKAGKVFSAVEELPIKIDGAKKLSESHILLSSGDSLYVSVTR